MPYAASAPFRQDSAAQTPITQYCAFKLPSHTISFTATYSCQRHRLLLKFLPASATLKARALCLHSTPQSGNAESGQAINPLGSAHGIWALQVAAIPSSSHYQLEDPTRVSRCSSYSPVQWTTKSYTQTALLQQVLICLSGLSVSTDQDFTSAIQVLPLTVRLKQQTYANQLKLYTMHSRYSLRAQLCWNPQRREGGREGGREEGREGGREEC